MVKAPSTLVILPVCQAPCSQRPPFSHKATARHPGYHCLTLWIPSGCFSSPPCPGSQTTPDPYPPAPQSTLLLHFRPHCFQLPNPHPSPHPDPRGRIYGMAWAEPGNSTAVLGPWGQPGGRSRQGLQDWRHHRASWVTRAIAATSTTQHTLGTTCCARCKGHGTCVFIGCPCGSFTLCLGLHLEPLSPALCVRKDWTLPTEPSPVAQPASEHRQRLCANPVLDWVPPAMCAPTEASRVHAPCHPNVPVQTHTHVVWAL